MMNAAPKPSLQNEPASALSALVDGELPPHELEPLIASLAQDASLHGQWNRYQVIGDVLRASAPAAAARSPEDFLAGFRARLQQPDPVPVQGRMDDAAPVSVLRQASAANDAVFRWKMVAGLASLAAVMAVSWTLLDTAPGTGNGTGAGPQLAQVSNGGTAMVPQASTSRLPVVVETPQGPVLRDPQLEALMAQHRQHGSPSALQMPTGFLRNATYDAPVR